VLRLSGDGLIVAADRLLPPRCPRPGPDRAALRGELEWTPGGRVGVELLVFPGPGSATGEDVLELHLPGSPPVVEAVLAGLLARGARLAEPGEFTRRAFLRGRLDLAQAEAVLDLVESSTAAGAAAAAGLLAGPAGAALQEARDALVAARTELEASLDFEEGDSQDLLPEEIQPLLDRAEAAIGRGLRGEARRRVGGGAPRIGLFGAPNAGKTSLFRRLTGAEGLVSEQAGTTRDRLEGDWEAPGQEQAWRLADGPGLGGAAVDPRDQAARDRAQGDSADLWWLLLDASDPAAQLPEAPPEGPRLVVWTKADRPRAVPEAVVAAAARLGPMHWVSALDGGGSAQLAAGTADQLARQEAQREARRGAGERHRAALSQALEAVQRAGELRRSAAPAELVAEELRLALAPLGELVGELTPEDLLDQIFGRFCLGK